MAYAELKNGQVFFQTAAALSQAKGSLLFVHGAGGTHQKWAGQLNESMEGWMTAALDLPGHGASAGSAAESVAANAESLLEFIEQSALPRPLILVGHSMGAIIVLQTALNYPERVAGLILIGAGARMPVNPQMIEQLAKGSFDTKFLKIAYGPEAPAELVQSELERMAEVSQQQLYTDFNACNNFDVSTVLGELDIPVLILVGDKDKMTPLKASQYLNDNIKNSVLNIVNGSGHHPMLEKMVETNQAIKQFLEEHFK
ncbi:MAG: alpha/beta hydrolase [Syntrophomonas sp.]